MKIIDVHSHFDLTEEHIYECKSKRYEIVKRVISINPYIDELRCHIDKHHKTAFVDVDNGVHMYCFQCGKIFSLNENIYFEKTKRMLQTIDRNIDIPFYTPPLTSIGINNIPKDIELLGSEIYGIKLYTGTASCTLNSMGKLNSKLPLLVHVGTKYNDEPKGMLGFLERYDGNICMSHFARFDKDALEYVKKHDNFFVDTSPANCMFKRYIVKHRKDGLYMNDFSNVKEFYERIIDIVGITKVIWGSDYPFGNVDEELEVVSKLNLTEQEARKLLYDNGKRFLGI